MRERIDNRKFDQMRKVRLIPNFAVNANGSVLSCYGNTKVICSAMLQEGVPGWMKYQGIEGGWITAEYSMLPYSTKPRKPRDSSRGKIDGRSSEIQRLIGRSIRAIVDLKALGARTLWIDCDVLDADGGTRTAAVTGSATATAIALARASNDCLFKKNPMKKLAAAVSAGVWKGQTVLDLNYHEDSQASADFNFVFSENLDFIEVQGSGEESTFSDEQMSQMIEMSKSAIGEIFEMQKEIVKSEAGMLIADKQDVNSLKDYFA